MHKLVLIRHGESTWNRENRFTGWTDVDLNEKGLGEAKAAGELLKKEGYSFDRAFVSVLKRALRTLSIVLDELDELWIPVDKSWRLNERHYGSLQGLNKAETAAKFGDEQVLVWRRSYDIPLRRSRRATSASRDMIRAIRGSRRQSFHSPSASRTRLTALCPTGTSRSRLPLAAVKRFWSPPTAIPCALW